jgi:hypothetical protein
MNPVPEPRLRWLVTGTPPNRIRTLQRQFVTRRRATDIWGTRPPPLIEWRDVPVITPP